MHLNHLAGRFAKLAEQTGLSYRLGPPATADALADAQRRLNVKFPEQARLFYATCDGLEVIDPPLVVLSLSELKCDGALLEFCRCKGTHRLALDTRSLNEAGQWSIVNADTGYRITLTLASFWSIRMWSWIESRRAIWCDYVV